MGFKIRNKKLFLISSLVSVSCCSLIIGPILWRNYKFGDVDVTLKKLLLNVMQETDNGFSTKYSNYLDQALNNIVEKYDGKYKAKLIKAIEETDKNKIKQVWIEIRDLFNFVYERNDHRGHKSNVSKLDPALREELYNFANTTEHDDLMKHKPLYLARIDKFLLFYDNKEKELLLEIMKKINNSPTIKQLYKDTKSMFLIWWAELSHYIDHSVIVD